MPMTISQCTSEKLFSGMVTISLLIHIAVAAFLMTQRSESGIGQPVIAVDLSMLSPAARQPATMPPLAPPEETGTPAPPAIPPAPEPQSPSAYEELQRGVRTALASADNQPQALQNLALGLGMTNGYFSTLAEGKTLRPDIREYYLTLLQQINRNWWVGKKGDTGWIEGALFSLVIARDGTIVRLEMVKSSGNRGWDAAMVKALKSASPLAPLPDSYDNDFFNAPLRFVAPLNLMVPAVDGTLPSHSDSSSSSSRRSISS